MNKIPSDRILAYRRHLYTHISLLLDVYGTGATVEDAAKLIYEHDEATHPSECLADLLMMFNPCEEDYLSWSSRRLELFPPSVAWRQMSGRNDFHYGATD